MSKHILIPLFLISSFCAFSQNDTLWFAVSHHIIAMDDGTNQMNIADIEIIMAELNRVFAPIKVQFLSEKIFFDKIYFVYISSKNLIFVF